MSQTMTRRRHGVRVQLYNVTWDTGEPVAERLTLEQAEAFREKWEAFNGKGLSRLVPIPLPPLPVAKVRDPIKYLPTAEEIKAVCREIRAKWSPDDRYSRRYTQFNGVVRWQVPHSTLRMD